ncbi:ribose-5-phosphate isomerase RpiA [Crenothrix polyspora]|uniref:Ribose 5-phosphate isomerase A n=1 Tax=Crenothrix polyspora TaxID=360316 RepID=A0A1R4HD82_9GAMM|nr:ribose-5-phosphate isomerase RpiA [Crenothrix polyspora]SJM93991.1 Ribose-5-phosphate isomerase A [Crenothrix polyspora]
MNDKERVAHYAAQKIKDGMLVGLGTGSTANYFIEELARRRSEDGLCVRVVSSSVVSAVKAQSLQLPLLGFESINHIDVYVDGADEVTPDLTLLKGRGFDLVREKLLARAADEFWVLIDSSKRVDYIGANYAIPIEVMPFAWQMVKHTLELLGGRGNLRQTTHKDGLVVSSYGSLVLDMTFESGLDSQVLNNLLNNTPGVVEHGIFHNLATAVLCTVDDDVVEQLAN